MRKNFSIFFFLLISFLGGVFFAFEGANAASDRYYQCLYGKTDAENVCVEGRCLTVRWHTGENSDGDPIPITSEDRSRLQAKCTAICQGTDFSGCTFVEDTATSCENSLRAIPSLSNSERQFGTIPITGRDAKIDTDIVNMTADVANVCSEQKIVKDREKKCREEVITTPNGCDSLIDLTKSECTRLFQVCLAAATPALPGAAPAPVAVSSSELFKPACLFRVNDNEQCHHDVSSINIEGLKTASTTLKNVCEDQVCKASGVTDCEYKEKHICNVANYAPPGYKGPIPDCAFSPKGCRSAETLVELMINIGKMIFGVIGSLAFVMFVYGGFTMIMAFGNPEKFKTGQKILVAAVAGIIISLSAYLVIQFLLDALNVRDSFRAL